ncbi:hypothetical protein [Actinopolymorpha pittospori]
MAAIGGLAGATGLAAIGVALATDAPETGTSEVARRAASAGQPVGGDGDSKDGDKGKDDEVKQVPCDPDLLIAALVRGNAEGVANLELEPKCAYTLTAFEDDDGLPLIVGRIKIDGNGATIVRAANAEPFRIFNVASGGNLTLRDLTVKGGDAQTPEGGGGLLVQVGGRASIEASEFTLNRTTGLGGAIFNRGVTRIVGGGERKDDTEKDGHGREGSWNGASEFTLNTSVGDGGAIANTGALTVENARLTYNNSLASGGALANAGGGVAKISRTEIEGNHASVDGGGLTSVNTDTNTQLRDSSVTGNTAGNDGGGLTNLGGGQLYARRVDISHNTATDDGGGVAIIDGTTVIDRSKINENNALTGMAGGVFDVMGELVLRHSEVNQNRAFGPGGQAGGIVNIDGDVTLSGTHVVENAATMAPGGIFSNNDAFAVDDDSTIIKNRPTNCEGSPNDVPNCFG